MKKSLLLLPLISLSLMSFQSSAYIILKKDKVQQHNMALDIKGGFGYKLGDRVQDGDVLSSEKLSDGSYLRKVVDKAPVEGIENYYVLTDKNSKIYAVYGNTNFKSSEDCEKAFNTHLPLLQKEFPYLKKMKNRPFTYIGGDASRWVEITCTGNINGSYKFFIKYQTEFPVLYELL